MESNLIVGKKYKIPTIRGEPVLLPKHTDVEFFNFHTEHYHFDYRFITGDVNMQVVIAAHESPVEYKEVECVRANHPPHPGFLFSMWKMMCAFRWSSLKCGICPHKGVKTGEGSCPGHGLIWDKEGLLKHRNCRLYFRLNHSQVKQELGWEYRDAVNIHVTAKVNVISVSLLADDESLGTNPLHYVPADIGDTITVRDQKDHK